MRNLLLQLDTSPHPSVFDRVVALDSGADEVLSYGGVTENAVRDLVHGAIFTRAPRNLRHTAIFIGGNDIAAGERLLAAARQAFFGPLRVSVMLDSDGSNTTAVAAVEKLQLAAGNLQGRRVVITAGTGAVGQRAAGLLAQAGAEVTITSRRRHGLAEVTDAIGRRFARTVQGLSMADSSQATAALEGAELLLNAGPPGVLLVPRQAWAGRAGLRAAADLNAVPPPGVEGIEANDDGVERERVTVFGALGVGNLKMRIHRACIAALFERTDLVLDAETIAGLARTIASPQA
jgi:hypothetical protein